MKKFSIVHPFFEFMGSLGDWMILNVLFVVTCLPVITIGTSLTAIYQVSLRRIRKESRYAAKEYIQAFRQEWKDSTKLWMIFLCTGGILLFDVLYGKNLPGIWNIAIGCLVVLWMFSFTYAFPLQARFKNSIKNTIINAFYLAFRNLPVTLLMASAGEAAEAVEYTGCEDPKHNGEYSNSWYSYAWMTARKLNAEIHDIAQGGIALMDGTGWFHAPDYIGMETAWDKIRYNPELGKTLDWDFGKYDPQLIIVAIGQNDSNPEDYMKEDFHGEKAVKWRRHYKGFLNQLRTIYPSAYIVCCTTLLRHDKAWDQAIGQAVEELQDERITQYLFGRNGDGTPGHLRIAEAEEMADELAAYIEDLNIEGWE